MRTYCKLERKKQKYSNPRDVLITENVDALGSGSIRCHVGIGQCHQTVWIEEYIIPEDEIETSGRVRITESLEWRQELKRANV